jgi:predicted nucleic acid-binding protein
VIVADTNILLPLFLPSELSERVARLATLDPDWAAPALWRSEFRNALVTQMRVRQLALNQAIAVMEMAQAWIQEREFFVASPKILPLAAESGCTAYDCEYIALALDLRVPCVTLDQALLKAFPGVAISLEKALEAD